MSFLHSLSSRPSTHGEAAAIRSSQAVIEFDLTGKILDANENFLKTVGYDRAQVVGSHHSMFVEPAYAASAEYAGFWKRLASGEAIDAQFLRVGKGGNRIWLQATYTPILDRHGRPIKVIKFATDITAQKGLMANYEGQLAAIHKVQAVIEFDLSGTILEANGHFCSALGYTPAEIIGRHHSMFLEEKERRSDAYARFWQKLARGEYDEGQYLRIGKGGKQVWIQASYNPILDALGKPYKVVKYATDISASKLVSEALRSAVQESQAVITASKSKDLTKRISMDGKSGEIGELCAGLNELLGSFSEVVGSISDITTRITSGSARIGTGSHELAQRTEEQASSLEQTAATTEQLAASVKQSSQRAGDATLLGEKANQIATRGGSIVGDAVHAMERIEKASNDIGDIIRVIDDIAFQTNLLALNAAVEAARAGDAGKGFAVVASEVRTLAQRSGEAAKGISNLIANSTLQVATGVKLVKDAGLALAEIVQSSTSVAEALADISSASHEQANGIEEVAKVVAHMDEMTQSNSVMAEQSAGVAQELQKSTALLRQLVEGFKVDGQIKGHIAEAVMAELNQAAPQQRRASSKRIPTPAARHPLKLAAGGSEGGWSEF